MIISASYKTDIPTFYGDWFINRLDAGYCKIVNAYNGRVSRVSLRSDDVDGFVFWTKNLGPFLPHLAHVHERGFPFIVQYTINGYPRALESNVTDASRSIAHVRQIARTYSPSAVVWRYDTILHSSLTDRDFHLNNFTRLAEQLAGYVDEVVISFAHLYQKTIRNLNAAAQEHRFHWWDPPADEKRTLVSELVERAVAHRIRLTVCSQADYLVPGAGEARCVDAKRFEELILHPLPARLKGNREGCGCYESRDIGEYDTCPHGCVYCYAVRNQALSKEHFRKHDPYSEFLFQPARVSEDGEPSGYQELPIFRGTA